MIFYTFCFCAQQNFVDPDYDEVRTQNIEQVDACEMGTEKRIFDIATLCSLCTY